MFVVFKRAGWPNLAKVPAGNRKFPTYEAARQWARKLIRKSNKAQNDLFWTSNPQIGDYGYSIKKVD